VPEFEALRAVRDFVETGGDVLLLIGLVSLAMWTLILERAWYFRLVYPRVAREVAESWRARRDHRSWNAHQIRQLLTSENRLKLGTGLKMIKTLVALCPLLGLLGTVTGMIEVFDVMAVAGSGNARAMASGVSKATIPTMAGMVAALSGLLISAQLERFAESSAEQFEDHLEIVHQ